MAGMRASAYILTAMTALAGCGGGGGDSAVVDSGGLPVDDAGRVIDAAPRPDGSGAACMAGNLLAPLGKSHVLVGGAMADSTANSIPIDLRYLYLSGGIADGAGPCTSCASGCMAGGTSCANSGPGCAWWGCWQYDQVPPGDYVKQLLDKTATRQQLPMVTYYMILQAGGSAEGAAEVTKANDATFMRRYYADWRFLLQRIGQTRALLHIEPDFWGYAEQVNENPTAIPAAVASANATDCAAQPNTIAGMGRCMIAMVRKYAPNALVGLHASGWGTKIDVLSNTSMSLDVAAEARKLGTFMLAVGAGDGDFVVIETSDRDAGYYASIGQNNRTWDPMNLTLPNYRQAMTWAKALAEQTGKPNLWWQLPLGNVMLNNTSEHWRDTRVDYFFDHPEEIAAAHGAGMAFGAGAGGQTTPETDNGHFAARVRAYAANPQPVCP